MSIWVSLLNDGAVSVFGSVLSASFCNALNTRRNCRIFWCFMTVISLLQGWIYSIWDAESLRQIFPLVIHLPLILVLHVLTKRLLWSIISVLSAYLCCQLRRWLALLTVALASGGPMMQDVVELIVTLPILLLLLRFVTPAIRKLAYYPAKLQFQFGVIPALYYAFDYVTVVYTDLLTSGLPVVVEFMPFVCCGAYLVFLLYHSAEEQKRSQLQQAQNSLDIQLKQSVREISALRESQALAHQYRHDLRHHDIVLDGVEMQAMRLPKIQDTSLEGCSPDVLIIGGGISGASIARELSKWKLDILLVDKEADLAVHASGRNDGEVHPGVDLGKGSLKQHYVLRGNRMYGEVCSQLEVPFRRCGQYVGFTDWLTLPAIFLYACHRKYICGVKDTKIVSRKKLREAEPELNPKFAFALYNSSAGCVCPYELTIGIPVIRTQTFEVSGIGAAMTVFVGMGEFDSYKEAAENMVFQKERFEPDLEQYKIYNALYGDVFRNIYGKLSPLYQKINDIIHPTAGV